MELGVTEDDPYGDLPEDPGVAPFLGQLKSFALPLVEALGVGPVDVGAGDAVKRGDGVAGTGAGGISRGVCDRDPCVGQACGFVRSGERAREAGLRHSGLLAAG